MTAREKLIKYIDEHKGPFETSKLVNHFLMGKTTVLETLRELENEKRIRRERVKNKTYWHKTLTGYAVALSPKAHRVPVAPPAKRWSVYDDRTYD